MNAATVVAELIHEQGLPVPESTNQFAETFGAADAIRTPRPAIPAESLRPIELPNITELPNIIEFPNITARLLRAGAAEPHRRFVAVGVSVSSVHKRVNGARREFFLVEIRQLAANGNKPRRQAQA